MKTLEKVGSSAFDKGRRTFSDQRPDQTAPSVGNGIPGADDASDDFLTRERAALGPDADLFASSNDHAATVQDGDNDLLGDGGNYEEVKHGGEEITEFESSFPAVDSSNNVRLSLWPIEESIDSVKLI